MFPIFRQLQRCLIPSLLGLLGSTLLAAPTLAYDAYRRPPESPPGQDDRYPGDQQAPDDNGEPEPRPPRRRPPRRQSPSRATTPTTPNPPTIRW